MLQILSYTLRILLTAALVYCGAMTFVSVFRGFRASFMADLHTEARQHWRDVYWRAWRRGVLYIACCFVSL
jgi:hypothetical protein